MNDNSVQVKLLFFAKARELAGFSECHTQLPDEITYKDLVAFLHRAHNLEALENSFLIALNSDYLESGEDVIQLKANDEIAVIPPISGG